MRPMEFLVEITVSVDHDEVDTEEKLADKKQEIRRVIESLDPSIGIFQVESLQ